MTVAVNAVDRPLVDAAIDAIDEDTDVSDDVMYYVLAALEGPTALRELLDGVSTPHVPESSADRTVEEPVGALLTSIGVAGFRGIGPKAILELHPAPGITVVSGGRNRSGMLLGNKIPKRDTSVYWGHARTTRLDPYGAGQFKLPTDLPGLSEKCIDSD
ncbi:hypothetical protein QM588_18330 [Rhodococcus sp. IEGM 1354]|uniref:hypothetical protein n=1 Tax=Rhodococcus sp. IEGM 1354 TaxID=3047088 RepID=UPI0024B74A5E|nr:hypothetical protein [Rhodococcus sp. IEGM 1354]MDI9932376.1 hypothetical protein [Rhodococcus sp. IEGM 1354]